MRPRVEDARIALRTNGDDRRPPTAQTSALWRTSASDFATAQAAAQIARALTPMLRAMGFRDVQLLRVLPVLTHIGSIVYRADAAIERHQAEDPDGPIVDEWGPEIMGVLGSLGIVGPRVRAAVAPLLELAALESALVRGSARQRWELERMIDLRPFDLVLHSEVCAEIAGTDLARSLQVPLRELYVLRDVLDDLCSIEEDSRAGTFNCYLVAERLWGRTDARDVLDERLRVADGRIVDWLRSAHPASVCALAVAVAEPCDDEAADAAHTSAEQDPEGARLALTEHFQRGAAQAFGEEWRAIDQQTDARSRMSA